MKPLLRPLVVLTWLCVMPLAYAGVNVNSDDKEGTHVIPRGGQGSDATFESVTTDTLTMTGLEERVGSASQLDHYIDFNDEAQTAIGGGLYLRDSHTWFLTETDDINTAITAASDGDTLFLAPGIYTITADLDVTKSLQIIGAGVGNTLIQTNTAAITMFNITTSNVLLSKMSLSNTGTGTSTGIRPTGVAGTVISGIVVDRVDVTMSGSGVQRCFHESDASGMTINLTCSSTSSNNTSSGLFLNPTSTAETTMTWDIYGGNIAVSGAGSSTSYALNLAESTATNNTTVRIFDTFAVATEGGTVTSAALFASGNNILVTMYGGYLSGTDNDVSQAAAATLSLDNTALLNQTISGSTIVSGIIVARGLQLGGSAGPIGCLMMEDTDSAGWTEVTVLNGVVSASTDADGVCDGS